MDAPYRTVGCCAIITRTVCKVKNFFVTLVACHPLFEEKRPMKYFVTGATGFVGNALARKLRETGHDVRASVRNIDKAKDLQTLGVQLFKGDVTDKESMREAMTGVYGVYHVAG